jgi:6-phosphogluconolactonase (cycloisomerase 2 family)
VRCFALLAVAACGRIDFDPIDGFALYAATESEVDAYRIRTDGTLLPPVAYPTLGGFAPIIADPHGRFVIVGGSPLESFTVNGDGALAHAETVTVANTAISLTLDATGSIVYVGSIANTVDSYAVDRATGALTHISTAPLRGGVLKIDSGGQLLYAVDGLCDIEVAAIDASGVIGTPQSYTPPGCVLSASRWVDVDPTSSYVYVATDDFCGVYGFAITDRTTGAIATTQVPGSPLVGDCYAQAVLDPTAQWLYAGGESYQLYVAPVDAATGAIGPGSVIPNAPVDVVRFHPNGRFLYGVPQSFSTQPTPLYAFAFDPATGAVTPLTGGSYDSPYITDFAIAPF